MTYMDLISINNQIVKKREFLCICFMQCVGLVNKTTDS